MFKQLIFIKNGSISILRSHKMHSSIALVLTVISKYIYQLWETLSLHLYNTMKNILITFNIKLYLIS